MENIELCWLVMSQITMVIIIIVEGWFFYRFVRPFLIKNKYAKIVGAVYSAVMLVLYFVPYVIEYPRIYGSIAAFLVMCIIDRRNITQKIFLVITMYLFRWIAHGIALAPRNIVTALFITTPYIASRIWLQFILYIIVELLHCTVMGVFLYLMVAGTHKMYVDKRENVSRKELMLLLSVLLTVLTGYFAFSFFSGVYERDMGQSIGVVYKEYNLLKILYQIISCSALFITIMVYQRIKMNQREEKEDMILAEQMENVKSHISEVEKLYRDIRGLKHDMGTHIMIMENLLMKSEKEESEKYLLELKRKWSKTVTEIKTGNPVTDVILTEKQKEAKEKEVDFSCEFFYPVETKVEAFDVSIILNNAIANAIEAAKDCTNPYVSVFSYRKKNAYMIEVRNSIKENVRINEETGLPETTKRDTDNHGYGLINIRKVARKYYGDIDIEQEENSFLLSILLMVE